MYSGDSFVDSREKFGTKCKIKEEFHDDENVLMSGNDAKDDDWLDGTQQSCNLSNSSANNYDIEDAIAMMYKFALLHSSFGNFGYPKPPPTVSDKDQTNLIAYITAIVEIKEGQQKHR